MATGHANGHTNGHGNGYHGNGYHEPASRVAEEPSSLPPHNLAAERGVLAAILLDNEVLEIREIESLTDDDFYRGSHQVVFRAIRQIQHEGKAVDAVTLAEELQRRGEFDRIGGDLFIFEIVQSIPSPSNAKYHAQILREKTLARLEEENAQASIEDVRSNRFTAEQLRERSLLRVGRVELLTTDEEAFVDLKPWPEPPAEAMWHGLAGEIVKLIAPHTEADPIAILAQLLVGFGSIVGRKPHWNVEATRHGCNLFLCVVGNSSKARKGTSWDHVRRLLGGCDPTWESERILGGLSSGEGMIWSVRDPVFRRERVAGTPALGGGGYQEAMVDPGVNDKRACFVESEFGSTLAVLSRDGNTLSGLMRQAWDSGCLRSTTKNNPARATGAHMSVIAHITCEELHRRLTQTDAANGFANRFLWLAARRSQYLPLGGRIHTVNWAQVYNRLNTAVDFATDEFESGERGRELKMDAEAGRLWCDVYPRLSEPKPGLLGAVTSRAEAQTMRLAMIYALLDLSPDITPTHLQAALALWRYCEQSAAYVFGETLGEPEAEKLLGALREAGDAGLTLTQIRRKVFNGHRSKDEIGAILATLSRNGLAHQLTVETGGKPSKAWFSSVHKEE